MCTYAVMRPSSGHGGVEIMDVDRRVVTAADKAAPHGLGLWQAGKQLHSRRAATTSKMSSKQKWDLAADTPLEAAQAALKGTLTGCQRAAKGLPRIM